MGWDGRQGVTLRATGAGAEQPTPSPISVLPSLMASSASAAVKAAALRFMPDTILQLLKRMRYVHTVRSFWSPEAAIMVALVDTGDYVLDIGAYAGWYTRVLSNAVGADGRVHSFEPIHSTFSLLTF